MVDSVCPAQSSLLEGKPAISAIKKILPLFIVAREPNLNRFTRIIKTMQCSQYITFSPVCTECIESLLQIQAFEGPLGKLLETKIEKSFQQ